MKKQYISHILIVDDIKSNLISLRALLEVEDVNVIEASSGNEALKILFKEKIDLILLDVQMPEMDGFEVAEILRKNKKTENIPIIFITAINKSEEYIFRGYSLGAVDYIYKPIKNELLRNKINVFIRLSKQAKIIEEKTFGLEEKIKQLEKAEETISKLAKLDGLTNINNRRTFNEEFEKEWSRGVRNKRTLSVIMIDIDVFKSYNDSYGHIKGDSCLISVANELKNSMTRGFDIIARYGGEEFVALLPNTEKDGAMYIAEKIRSNIENLKIDHISSKVKKTVTISLGVSSVIPDKKMKNLEFLSSADDALYEAKNNGRNRVEYMDYINHNL